MYSNYERIVVTRRDRILTLTLTRPEVRNATDPVMHEELTRIFRDVARDPDSDVVILTGAGDSFSAGGDFNSMKKRLEDEGFWEKGIQETKEMLFALLDLDKPVIARINGPAIGLGATLALFCDITVAVESAKIADPHVRAGLVAGDGGSIIWPALIGFPKAKELLLMGDTVTGKEAAELGLVNYAVSADELDNKVFEIAERLARGAQKAIQGTKRAINMSLRIRTHEMLDTHLGFETASHHSSDHRAAVEAFLNKEKPVFGAGRQKSTTGKS